MKRLLAVLAALFCVACSSRVFLGPDVTADYGALFDSVWSEFDLHYSFFDYKGVDWDASRAHYRPLAVAAGSDNQFALVLGKMMADLRDVHVSITPGSAGSTIRFISPFDTIATGFSAQSVQARYIQDSKTTSGGHLTYGMAAATVGYVRISTFVGTGWAGEIDDALAAMPAATGIIVDIRSNAGGTTATATEIAGRFADKGHAFGYVRLRDGPAHTDFTDYLAETVTPIHYRKFARGVYVLTNRRDFSAAEGFVLAMRVLPYVAIIGDTTAGASGSPMVRELANGWTYQLSEWIEYTPGRQMYEGIGLPPDIYVRATSTGDAALERAIALARP